MTSEGKWKGLQDSILSAADKIQTCGRSSCLVLATRTTAVSSKPDQMYWREMPFTTAKYNVQAPPRIEYTQV